MTLPIPESTKMFAEAGEAGAVIAAQRAANTGRIAELAGRLRRKPPAAVLTCARGSSDHAATFAKYLIETRLGVLTSSQAPSIASVYGAALRANDALCLAISQSGKSPDLLATVEAAKRAGAYSAALVNVEDSPLAQLADSVVPLSAGPELSVAATKSYIAAIAAIIDLVAAWAGDEALDEALSAAPAQLQQAWAAD
ncbi:MAG: SIS domain-containing protein, partial [Sphingomonadaceae bacterium]